MSNWRVREGEDPYVYLDKHPEIKPGDTIEVITGNQMGSEKYIVELDTNGEKKLRLVADWGNSIYEENNEKGEAKEYDVNSDIEEGLTGGKRKRHKKRKSRKHKKSRKSRKSRKNRRSRRSRRY
jgi:hypothetical protein